MTRKELIEKWANWCKTQRHCIVQNDSVFVVINNHLYSIYLVEDYMLDDYDCALMKVFLQAKHNAKEILVETYYEVKSELWVNSFQKFANYQN